MTDTPDQRGAFARLAVLMVTAFIDMLGLLMVLPLLPFYAAELGAGGFVVGMLVSSFAVAQLVSAPLWGRFSDKYGRRPALLVGLGASAVAYLVFAYADSLWLLFLSRIVQGAGGGTVSVVQAYVADATRPEDRAKSLGWLSAATNAGVAVGPVIGSLLNGAGRSTPGLVAAAFCVINVLFAWRFLGETRTKGSGAGKVRRSSRSAVWRVVSHSGEPASRLIWIYAVNMGAFQGVTAILALFLAVRFGVTERTIGWVFMYLGTISVVVRALALGKLVDRLGEARLSRYGVVLLAGGLGLLPLTRELWQLAAVVALLPLGTAFTFPCVTALLSRVVAGDERGLYMGVQQTFGGAARVLFPLLTGWAFDRLGVAWPFVLAAVLASGTLLLSGHLEATFRPQPASPDPVG
ncbi:MAG: MFS transporter [Gemmatimonadaceae bacterium]|jgi:multidrug resistance protein|nr:MFS transporter [Gemmatimonadaceae bacterium]